MVRLGLTAERLRHAVDYFGQDRARSGEVETDMVFPSCAETAAPRESDVAIAHEIPGRRPI